jgi:hypothetical protein
MSLLLGVTTAGCSQFRGIPTHGGGKRFDEEQRAVAGAVRRTIAYMDLGQLQGRRTLLNVTNLFTSGSGTVNWPGPQFINLQAGTHTQDFDLQRYSSGGYTDENREAPADVRATLNYRLSGDYRAANVPTEGDLAYLRAALDMKARHCGIVPVREKPEVVLHVLVDVLGTNRSQRDFLLLQDEELLASCEVTYYAQDVKTGKLVFPARQTGARATYREQRVRFTPISSVERSVDYAKPTFFPVDGKGPTTQPDRVDLSALPLADRGRLHADAVLREEALQVLYERARFHIESGNAQAAGEYIQEMREIDPGYRGLGELSAELERMTSP